MESNLQGVTFLGICYAVAPSCQTSLNLIGPHQAAYGRSDKMAVLVLFDDWCGAWHCCAAVMLGMPIFLCAAGFCGEVVLR